MFTFSEKHQVKQAASFVGPNAYTRSTATVGTDDIAGSEKARM